MKRFGLALSGCEAPIEELIKNHLKQSKVDEYTLIEVGSAGCVSLRAMSDIISENWVGRWKSVGFDLPDGWSIDWNQIKEAFGGHPYIIRDGDNKPFQGGMNLMLLADPRTYLRDAFPDQIDFAFIDGCHGKCAVHDFQAIEAKVRPGGLVMFHDVGALEQGIDWQPHCGEYINVRKHLTDLGLFDDKYPGWQFVGEIPGSKVWGGDGHSCGVFRKV